MFRELPPENKPRSIECGLRAKMFPPKDFFGGVCGARRRILEMKGFSSYQKIR
jgi:hypothetical protein